MNTTNRTNNAFELWRITLLREHFSFKNKKNQRILKWTILFHLSNVSFFLVLTFSHEQSQTNFQDLNNNTLDNESYNRSRSRTYIEIRHNVYVVHFKSKGYIHRVVVALRWSLNKHLRATRPSHPFNLTYSHHSINIDVY